jgi:signal transduction histidine kinase
MDLPLAPSAAPVVRVLLVEDTRTDVALAQRRLAGPGEVRFEVTVAGSLAGALAVLDGDARAEPVDCVLLDLALPDAQGLEALTAIRERAPGVAVIVLTGQDDDELGERALGLGAQDFIARDDATGPVLRRAVRHARARQQDRRLLEQAAAELAREVDERHEAEAARARALAELERSNAELSQFAYVAAHDLRSPLGVVAGYAELLADHPAVAPDTDAQDLVARVQGGVTLLQALVDDLLAYCAVGTAPARRQPVDLEAVAAEVVAGARHRGADIHVGPLPVVEGDPVQLRQLLDNLVTNAVKYVPADRTPQVWLVARPTAEGWELVVADNGIGIPEDQRERAFAMFQRLRGLAEVEGTGIGLAICRRVVEHHGGRIWIEDNKPVGARVRFTLPAPVGPAAGGVATRPAEPAGLPGRPPG